jgi:hypothetical protein
MVRQVLLTVLSIEGEILPKLIVARVRCLLCPETILNTGPCELIMLVHCHWQPQSQPFIEMLLWFVDKTEVIIMHKKRDLISLCGNP